MKKKVLILITVVLLLIAGASGGYFILEKNNRETLTQETQKADIPALIKENKDTVFSFLTQEKPVLPDNMSGFLVDVSKDIDFSSATDDGIKTSIYGVFEKVNAISPDTVVIRYDTTFTYESKNIDAVETLINAAHENGLLAILFIDDDKHSAEKSSAASIEAFVSEYSPDALMLNTNDFSESAVKNASEIKTMLNEKNIFFGTLFNDSATAEKISFITSGTIDFSFIKFNTTLALGTENNIKDWAETAIGSNCRFYAMLRNELIRSDENWNDTDEIYNQLRAVNNYAGFSGAVFNSHSHLQNNDEETTVDFYFYNEYFNNAEYTSLTINSFAIENNSVIKTQGTSDPSYPVLTWCTADNAWKQIPVQGEDGSFTAEIKLIDGENKVSIKHKNALYTYHIDKAVDVMTEHSATIQEGALTLSVKALKGSYVTAAVANTELIELTEQPSEEKYALFTATYEIPAKYSLLTTEQISYAASYNGIDDIVMCGEEKALSPYDNHNLGNADMCIVTTGYSETTSTASPDDTSDPTCTPQLQGAYAYVSGYSVNSNTVIYSTTTGMKIHADLSKLILGAYVMPANRITVESVKTDNGTTLTFSSDYLTFIKTIVAPQEYRTGALERIYNIDEFTGEYIDIMFMNTAECSYVTEPDFSGSDIISEAQLYSNSEEGFMTLRLIFREKGDFAGYSLRKNRDGTVSVRLKKTADNLSGTVIMLDPGHGGYGSPGTYSTSTVYEHEVVYSIANKAADILREYGATVIITRGEDEALFLNERVDMIREYAPDVFASIHCDGSDNASWFGTHTFYYKNYSMPLAASIHRQLVSAYRSYVYTDTASEEYENVDMDCKFFPYMVTRVEECPSVLIECGYLTNETDAAFLTSENGQLITATAIAQGIVDYISLS